jgi:peptidoglycan/xylan/chitin deacetylase (PgdA/CDA1 family)
MTAGIGYRVQRALRVAAGLSPWPAGGLVLLYHRVTAVAADPQRLAVAPERFSDHLGVLCRRGVPMSLEAMTARASEGTLPANAFAITFDDGYADVLTEAAPRLRAAGVPATVFVSTGWAEADREFWWDELERLLLGPGTLPRRLLLPVGDLMLDWDLASSATLGAIDVMRHQQWTVEDGVVPTARHAVYLDLCARLRGVSGESRERTLAALAQIAGLPREARPSHRRLSAGELLTLASIEGITIGSHTASHPSLAALTVADQREEIEQNTRDLEALLGRRVTAFAFPFGGSGDRPENFAALAGAAGITVACTTEQGSVRRDTNPLRIPRLTVRDWPQPAFESQWAAWTGTV